MLKKMLYICYLIFLCNISLFAETFIGDGGNTSPYTETKGTITMTVSGTGGVGAGNGLNGVGGITADSIYTTGPGTMTISFNTAVDVSSIRLVNSHASSQVFVLTPNIGSSVSSISIGQFTGTTVTPNFTE